MEDDSGLKPVVVSFKRKGRTGRLVFDPLERPDMDVIADLCDLFSPLALLQVWEIIKVCGKQSNQRGLMYRFSKEENTFWLVGPTRCSVCMQSDLIFCCVNSQYAHCSGCTVRKDAGCRIRTIWQETSPPIQLDIEWGRLQFLLSRYPPSPLADEGLPLLESFLDNDMLCESLSEHISIRVQDGTVGVDHKIFKDCHRTKDFGRVKYQIPASVWDAISHGTSYSSRRSQSSRVSGNKRSSIRATRTNAPIAVRKRAAVISVRSSLIIKFLVPLHGFKGNMASVESIEKSAFATPSPAPEDAAVKPISAKYSNLIDALAAGVQG